MELVGQFTNGLKFKKSRVFSALLFLFLLLVLNRSIVNISIADVGASYIDGGSFNTTVEILNIQASYVDGGSFNTTVDIILYGSSYVDGGSFNTTVEIKLFSASYIDGGSFNTTVKINYTYVEPITEGNLYALYDYSLVSVENVSHSRPTYTTTEYTYWFNSTAFSEAYCRSDIDMDGDVDIDDFDLVVISYGLTGSPGWIREDVIKDGIVNVLDAITVDGDIGDCVYDEDSILSIDYYNWKIGTRLYYTQNLTFTAVINWEEVDEDYIDIDVRHIVENETSGYSDVIYGTLRINDFVEPEETYLIFPGELFIVLMSVVILVVIVLVMVNLTEGLLKWKR